MEAPAGWLVLLLLPGMVSATMPAPLQVHLTLTGNPTEMAVSWAEMGDYTVLRSEVRFGTDATSMSEQATNVSRLMITDTENMKTYDYCGGGFQTRTLHMVLLKQLPLATKMYYSVRTASTDGTNATAWTAARSFRTIDPSAEKIRFLATADMGDPVSHSWTAIPAMNNLSAQCRPGSEDPIDLAIHAGDISYNLDIGTRGDDYVQGVSAAGAAFYPWMFGPGNHEADCNYTYKNYLGRFAAQNLTGDYSGSGSSRWYSFDLGPVHFISIDTDAYGIDEVAYVLEAQFTWLQEDLASVDRKKRPWTVLYGHRPMYCSSITAAGRSHLGTPKQNEHGDIGDAPPDYGAGFASLGLRAPPWDLREGSDIAACGIGEEIRLGLQSLNGTGRHFGIEPLMEKYGVDVYLCGHEHNYERLWPVMNGTITKGYNKPGKPVHIVTGSGGAYSKDTFGPSGPFDAFRSTEWSYSDISVNRTHVVLLQRLAVNSTIIDSMILSKPDIPPSIAASMVV